MARPPRRAVAGALAGALIARFPDADGRTGRVGSGERRLKVAALGDSMTAGYAVSHHRATVAGQLAVRLAARYAAAVEWEVCARSGATDGTALALVSVGVNDVKNRHSVARFRRELGPSFKDGVRPVPYHG